ncbi:MAG: pyridoxal-5'-phosphate-dependent protein subunit beta [Micavibrio aeruginosavorus]|uniref:Pyridoxal-5'-phosphate-dependent protein subunit beta n=1 Tax=Micavibrio aeruginosavorus TaxID=349221 RepID=A0A2W5N3Y2_9BACT|nr:MAG: pyridoxal-5'-phosphate-dependent protein subunit beta [Micavibrio aeruginosavorus]
MIVEKMTDLIGNTPMIRIPDHVTGLKNISLYAKLEMLNPFGSVKDRTVWGMIKDDLDNIAAHGMTIYENSSGNTAKSLAAIASSRGVKFKLVSALKKVKEQKEILQILGAEIEEIVNASNCFDPSDPNDPQYLIEKTVRDNPSKAYFPSQFTNEKNPAYHEETTAKEILDDLGAVDYFFGGLGTTGSSLGIANRLKRDNPKFKAIGVMAQTGHFIPGIRNMAQMMESSMFQKDYYDCIYPLTEEDGLQGMLTLARDCAILCGPSSGANFTAAIRHLRGLGGELTEPCNAVFIVCDRMEWYISYIQERMPELFGYKELELPLHKFDSSVIHIVPSVYAAELENWRSQNSGALIVDTRTPQSFDLFHIPNSINMPQDIFEKWVATDNPVSKDTSVLFVCAIGERSRHYAAYLSQRGYKAYNLEGGIMSWVDLGLAA